MTTIARTRTIPLSSSDEFTTLAVDLGPATADGRTELAAFGLLPDVFTVLRLTDGERRELAMALLRPGEMVKGRRKRICVDARGTGA